MSDCILNQKFATLTLNLNFHKNYIANIIDWTKREETGQLAGGSLRMATTA